MEPRLQESNHDNHGSKRRQNRQDTRFSTVPHTGTNDQSVGYGSSRCVSRNHVTVPSHLHQVGTAVVLSFLVLLIPAVRHCTQSMVQGKLGVPASATMAPAIWPSQTTKERQKNNRALYSLTWPHDLLLVKFQCLVPTS